MRKALLLILVLFLLVPELQAQCGTTNIPGNFTPNNGDTLSGTYNIGGDLTIPAGVTVHVRPYIDGGCGELFMNVTGNVSIAGTIRSDSAGFPGGQGGVMGTVNNPAFVEACPLPSDQCGDVTCFGGGNGANANPGGGGLGGVVGANGTGRKNRCLNFGDVGGRVGASGGGGGGGGGSYGGGGGAASNGGAGTLPTMSEPDPTCTSNPIAAGAGGNGGLTGTVYGTAAGMDIDLGSGGGGAGGGGRGRQPGTAGLDGGAGGGLVRIESGGNFTFSGLIVANGANGGSGGVGGAAGPSPRCCTDLCPGVDEYTHTGAGGGGAGGGGGSGGGVLLRCMGVANITGTINANGGNGGPGAMGGSKGGYPQNLSCILGNSSADANAAAAGNQGGGGAGGRVKVFVNDCAPGNVLTPSITVNGGSGAFGAATVGTIYTGTDSSFVVGTSLPASQNICFNGDPNQLNALPAMGGFGGLAYQWQSQANCAGPWTNIAGATTLNYDPPAGLQVTTCYRLEVTSGTCVAYSDTLTVVVSPALTATVNPSGNVARCIGDSLTMTTSGGANASYQWLLNGVPVAGAVDSFFTVGASGSYVVIISYLTGCSAMSAPTVVTFDPPPPAFVAALGDTNLCPGDSVTLQAFGGGSYQWLLNGTAIGGATGATITVGASGQYAVEVTSVATCTDTSAATMVTLNPAPTAGISAGGPTNFCAGDSVVLTGSGGTTWMWLLNGQVIAGATNSTYAAMSTGAYQAVAMNGFGCADTSAVENVVADPVPVATLNPVGLPVACEGDSVMFLAGGGGGYNWLFNNQPISDTTSYLMASVPGDYTVIVTSPAGCVDTSTTFAFTWYPPISPVVSAAGSQFLCPGQTSILAVTATGAIGFQWFLNDTALVGETNPTYTAMGPGAYTIVVTDANGCDYQSPIFNIFPGSDPQAEIIPQGSLPLCSGDSIALLGQGGDSYQWLLAGQAIAGATDSILWVTQSGDYSLEVTTGCGMDTSAMLNVNIAAGPTAGFEYENYPGNEVKFIDRSISGATWLWDFGDGSTGSNTNLQNPFHSYPGPGTYQVTMITWDIFGCSDTITQAVIVTDPSFFIPNVFSPNGDGVNDVAQTNFGLLNDIRFHIYNRWGREVFFTNNNTTWWDGKFKGKDAPDGVYFYLLEAIDVQENAVSEKGNITLLR